MKETIELKRDCEAIAVPSGQRRILEHGTEVRLLDARGGSYTVSAAFHAIYRIDGKDADALGLDPQGADVKEPGAQDSLSEQLVWDVLKTVYDPELPVNIVELGLVYSCAIAPGPDSGKAVTVRMALTSPGCGMSNVLKSDVERKLLRLPDVREAHVEVVFDPPWDPSRMSDAARLQLGMDFDDRAESKLIQISRNQ
jgi:probable FeS assembly SUF system protein SufT